MHRYIRKKIHNYTGIYTGIHTWHMYIYIYMYIHIHMIYIYIYMYTCIYG